MQRAIKRATFEHWQAARELRIPAGNGQGRGETWRVPSTPANAVRGILGMHRPMPSASSFSVPRRDHNLCHSTPLGSIRMPDIAVCSSSARSLPGARLSTRISAAQACLRTRAAVRAVRKWHMHAHQRQQRRQQLQLSAAIVATGVQLRTRQTVWRAWRAKCQWSSVLHELIRQRSQRQLREMAQSARHLTAIADIVCQSRPAAPAPAPAARPQATPALEWPTNVYAMSAADAIRACVGQPRHKQARLPAAGYGGQAGKTAADPTASQ